jgi:hypothetical protein
LNGKLESQPIRPCLYALTSTRDVPGRLTCDIFSVNKRVHMSVLIMCWSKEYHLGCLTTTKFGIYKHCGMLLSWGVAVPTRTPEERKSEKNLLKSNIHK